MKHTIFGRSVALLLALLLFFTMGTPAVAANTETADAPAEPAGAEIADPAKNADPAEEQTEEPTEEPTEIQEPSCKTTGEHVFEAYTFAGDGVHAAVCALCGETFTAPCEYEEAFTPAGDGAHARACVLCGGTQTAPCEYAVTVTAPTQDEPGFTAHVCAVCGDTFTDGETPPERDRAESRLMGDLNGDGALTAADARLALRAAVSLELPDDASLPYADLTRDGAITAADARRILRAVVSLDPLPERHAFAAEVLRAPGCEATGAMRFACAYCGVSGETEMPAAGHTYQETARKEPNCTVAGFIELTCAVCGNGIRRTLRAPGHRFGEPRVTPAACTKDGKSVIVCAVCGETETTVLKAPGHAFGEPRVTPATCTKDGKREIVCAVCGETETTVLKAAGHKWLAAAPTSPKRCEACGEIVPGWTNVGGNWYYFYENGSRAEGKTRIDGKLYRFVKGVSQTGKTAIQPKTAMLGDSLVESLGIYISDPKIDFYGKVNLHADQLDKKRISGSSRTVLGELDGRDYDKVILLVGINDIGYAESVWREMYRGLIRDAKKHAPDAEIYVHSLTPVNNARARANNYTVTMAQINARNALLQKLAAEEKVRFLNATPVLALSNGQLPYDAASDGIHFAGYYSRIWHKWIQEELSKPY